MTDHPGPTLGFCQSCGAARIVDGQSHCASCGQRLLQRSEVIFGPVAASLAPTAQTPPPIEAIPAPPPPPDEAAMPATTPSAAAFALSPLPPGEEIPAPPLDTAQAQPGEASPAPPLATAQAQPATGLEPQAQAVPPPMAPAWPAPAPGPAAPQGVAPRNATPIRSSTPILLGLGAIGLVAVVVVGAVLLLKPGGGATGVLGPSSSSTAVASAASPLASAAQSTGAPAASPSQSTPAPTATAAAATPNATATPAQASGGVAVLRVNAAAMAVVASWGSDVTVWTTAANPATSLLGLPDGAVGLRDFPGQMTTAGGLFDALGEHRDSWYVCGGGTSDPFTKCPSIRVWFDRGTVTSLPGAIQLTFQAE